MHHIPHTGDLPNTVFTTAHSAMIIEPQNYLEGDPSRATTQQIRVVYGDSTTVKTFGAEPATCLVDPVGITVPMQLGFVANVCILIVAVES